MGQSWSRWQQHRNANTLRELAPKKTPGHDKPLPDLTRSTLLSALGTVATYLSKRRRNTTVIAVGGAVNTIHLRSRDVSHDVDFFNDYLTPTDFEHLVKGAREAAKRNAQLDESWFNNRLSPARAYDLHDAVQYLHRYLVRDGAGEVQYAVVREWFVEYELRWTSANDVVVGQVNAAYRARFHMHFNPIIRIQSV